MSLCVKTKTNKKLDYMNKLDIFEISLIRRFQKCTNFWNRTVDSYILPLWPCFAMVWLRLETRLKMLSVLRCRNNRFWDNKIKELRMPMQCQWAADALPMHCQCTANALLMQCHCSTIQCQCTANALQMQRQCTANVVPMQWQWLVNTVPIHC